MATDRPKPPYGYFFEGDDLVFWQDGKEVGRFPRRYLKKLAFALLDKLTEA